MLFDNNHYVNSHNKTTQEIVDMRFKEWEIRQAKEREERAELAAKLAVNKADITKPAKPAPAPQHETAFHHLLHKLHLV